MPSPAVFPQPLLPPFKHNSIHPFMLNAMSWRPISTELRDDPFPRRLDLKGNAVVLAVGAVVSDADLDPEGEDVVAAAAEVILDTELVIADALLVDVPVGERLGAADVRAAVATPALLDALLAVNEDGGLDNIVEGVPDIDLDDNLGVLVLLVELNNEGAKSVVVKLKSTSDGELEIVLDVGVVVTLAVPALLVAGVVAELLQLVRVLALAEDDNLSSLASNIDLVTVVVGVAVRPGATRAPDATVTV